MELKKKKSSHIVALKTALYYGAIVTIGVTILEISFNKFANDTKFYHNLQSSKGLIYISLTVVVVYLLTKDRVKQKEERLYSLAYYNKLTGLANRSKFEYEVSDKIRQYKNTDHKFAIIYMNVDNFRRINDTWGYGAGNELLCYIADILKKHKEGFYLYSYLAGDEFAMIVDKIHCKDDVMYKFQNLLQEFQQPWIFEKNKTFITFSAGIVIYPRHGSDIYTLLANVDTAMWHVKKHGKDGCSFYTADMQTKRVSYIQTAHQIKKALKNNEFLMYYQPQIDLTSKQVIGMEALIRWAHPERGIIPPMEFIPLAETTGEIHGIERFVLESVCKQKKEWEKAGYPPTVVSINVSGITLTRGDLAQEIKNLLEKYEINGPGIKIEVTETAIMTDMDLAISTLNRIRELGVQVALDDFGTGYSSLTYLQRLPIDIVKIDRSFIKNIRHKNDQAIIVQVVIKIAEALGLEVVAEGVETKEQLEYLIQSNCEQGQGYFFARPMPPEQMSSILKLGFIN